MPTIVHFDIPADNPERAKKFYEALFEWKIEALPGPIPYYLIETTDLNGEQGVGGGMAQRTNPEQKITNFIGVKSINEYTAKVEQLGGTVIERKWPVPGWGCLAVCLDTENNPFGLWEEDENAE
ncbi:MAG: VOC family protein [archaeon]|nr:VOC family protein [archaeon]